MLLFRLLCAVFLAWAMNWSLSRPEAGAVLAEYPEWRVLGLLGAAAVGYFHLAKRQGWGVVVAIANGFWSGALSMIVGVVFFMGWIAYDGVSRNVIEDLEELFRHWGETATPLVELLANVPLLAVTVGASTVAGVVTEFLHWTLLKLRKRAERRRS